MSERQITHSEECWKWHHECAVRRIEYLQSQLVDYRDACTQKQEIIDSGTELRESAESRLNQCRRAAVEWQEGAIDSARMCIDVLEACDAGEQGPTVTIPALPHDYESGQPVSQEDYERALRAFESIRYVCDHTGCQLSDMVKALGEIEAIVGADNAVQEQEPCDHPIHQNPGLIVPCPKCHAGADDDIAHASDEAGLLPDQYIVALHSDGISTPIPPGPEEGGEDVFGVPSVCQLWRNGSVCGGKVVAHAGLWKCENCGSSYGPADDVEQEENDATKKE